MTNTTANTDIRIDFTKATEDPSLMGMIFMNQTFKFPHTVGVTHPQSTTIDTKTIYVPREDPHTSPHFWFNQQSAQNLQPVGIILTFQEKGHFTSRSVTLNCIQAAEFMKNHSSCSFTMGSYLEEKSHYDQIEEFVSRLNLAAVRWMSKQRGIEPTDVVRKYSVKVNRHDVSTYQLSHLNVHHQASKKDIQVGHRVFNVQLSTIS